MNHTDIKENLAIIDELIATLAERQGAKRARTPRDTTGTKEQYGMRRNPNALNNQGSNDTPATPPPHASTTPPPENGENVDIHKLPAGTVLHSGISSYYRTSDHILTHRVGPWVSDIGSTITSANLAAQIRLQYKGDNAY